MGTEKRERQKANRAQKQQQLHQEAARRKTFRMIAIGVGAVAAVFLVAWIASNFVGNDDPASPNDTVVSVPATLPEITTPQITTPADGTATVGTGG